MNIRDLLRQRLAGFDPALDTTQGSPVDRQVVEPVAKLFDNDPLTTDTRAFLEAKFSDAFPGMVVARGDALSDVLISAADVFFDAYRQHLNYLRGTTSIANIDQLSDADADALAANWYVRRTQGTAAQGEVQITLTSARGFTLNLDAEFSTLGGVVFQPAAARAYTTDELLANEVSAGRYVIRVRVTCQTPGTVGNIAANTLRNFSGISNVASITNLTSFVGGTDGDTTQSLLSTKIPRVISERSLVTARGISARLATAVPRIAQIQVIGATDPEMERDKVEVTAFDRVLGSGVAVVLADSVSLQFAAPGDISIVEGAGLTLTQTDGTVFRTRVTRVIAESGIAFIDNFVGRSYVCRVDKYPATGFYAFTLAAASAVALNTEVVDRKIHLGGRADVYVRPSSEAMVDVTPALVADADTAYYGLGSQLDAERLNQVTLTHAAVVEGKIAPLDVLDIAGTRHVISDVISTSAGTTVVSCAGTFSVGTSGPWSTQRFAAADMAGNPVQVYPRRGLPELQVTGLIGQTVVSISTATLPDLVAAGVKEGDVLVVEGVAQELVIASLGDRNSVDINVKDPIFGTIPRSNAVIRRATQTPLYSPLSHVSDVRLAGNSVAYGRPQGVRIGSLSAEQPAYITGNGYIAPSLRYALPPECLILTAAQMEAYTIARRPGRDSRLDAPYTNTRAQVRPGTSVVLLSGTDNHSIELEIWNELLVTGTRNIFVHIDRTQTSPARAPAPRPGDVLRLTSGLNAGEYLIDDVLTHTFALSSLEDTTDNGDLREITLGARKTIRLSLVKIYGEFPEPWTDALSRALSRAQLVDPSFTLGETEFAAIAYSVFEQLLTGEGFASVPAIGDALSDPEIALGVPLNTSQVLFGKLHQTTRQGRFDVIVPSRGAARVVAERDGSAVGVRAPVSSAVTLEEVAAQLPNSNAVNAYPILQHSELLWGGALLVPDPKRGDLLFGDEDVRTWPTTGLSFEGGAATANSRMLDIGVTAEQCDRVLIEGLPVTSLEAQAPATLLVHDEIYTARHVEVSAQVFAEGTYTVWFPVTLPLTQIGYRGAVTTADPLAPQGTMIPLVGLSFLTADNNGLVRSPTNTHILGVPATSVGAWQFLFAVGLQGAILDSNDAPLTVTNIGEPQLLYTSRSTVSNDPLLCLASTAAGAAEITFLRSFTHVSAFTVAPEPGALVRLAWGDDVQIARVVSVDVTTDKITIDAPAQQSTGTVLNYGRAEVGQGGALRLGALPRLADADNSEDVNTLLNNGGASRVFLQSDVGAHVTLWGDTTERAHYGTYKITSVTTERRSLSGSEYVAQQTVQLEGADVLEVSTPVYFVVTRADSFDIPEAPKVVALCTAQFFRPVADSFAIVGHSTDVASPGALIVARRGQTERPSTLDISGVLVADSKNRNNPFNVVVPTARGALNVVALCAPQPVEGETCYATNTWGYGYDIDAGDRTTARSIRDAQRVLLPLHAYPNALNETFQVRASYTDVVVVGQSVVSNDIERVVCSDTRVRRMNVAYVGLRMTYVGGPTESQLATRIRDTINNSIRQGVSFGESDIANIAYSMGAQRVSLPVELYLCLEDLSRVRHRREVRNVLDASRFLHVDGTYRTFSLAAAPIGGNTEALGASIIVTRVDTTDRLIGSGGA